MHLPSRSHPTPAPRVTRPDARRRRRGDRVQLVARNVDRDRPLRHEMEAGGWAVVVFLGAAVLLVLYTVCSRRMQLSEVKREHERQTRAKEQFARQLGAGCGRLARLAHPGSASHMR